MYYYLEHDGDGLGPELHGEGEADQPRVDGLLGGHGHRQEPHQPQPELALRICTF